MYGVGEVERRGTRPQADDLALWREAEYLALEEVDLEGLHELLRVVCLLLPIEHLTQPRELLIEAARGAVLGSSLLVAPMGRDAVLVHAVHLLGADLNLEGTCRRTDDRRMQGLVHVELGHRDVVLETPRNGMPQVMDGAQARIAFRNGVDDDTQADEVVYL